MNKIEIRVNEGRLIGIVVNNCNVRYIAFRGIPFAKPPIGDLRFKDPVPAEPWSGDRDASKYGNNAVQINLFTRKVEGDEDCLYLNVYTTKIEPSKKRTVMVWVHGGGFYAGSGDASLYGPEYIVQKDVVLVTLNYRLGPLGFLNLHDKVATGNQGLKDVVMALKWVQKNISEFGGDPGNVTIFGESAGAGITHCLTLSPLAKGLFHKVISQSGVVGNPWAVSEWTKATDTSFRLAKKLGKATSDPKVAYEFLKTVDAKKLIEASHTPLNTEEERLSFALYFTPTLDYESSNPFFPEHPKEYISRGIQMPFLLGFTRNEGIFFLNSIFYREISKEDLEQVNADFKKAILPPVLSKLPEMGITVKELKSLYFGTKDVSEETLINYGHFLGDEFFVRGIMDIVQHQRSAGCYKSTYLYQYDYENETSPGRKVLNIGLPGVSHAEELFYLFYPELGKMSPPEPDSDNHKMMNHLVQMWTDFAKTGNPTPTTNLWLPLTGSQNDDYNYLNIDINPKMKTFLKGKERWNWETYKKKL
ncbi:PREDICTED: esterase E4 [Vollenhovia emeryi]|uniref:esterase E4 n=1 Tax=Vollenhovia emeryi TaxID=411798 RepID=UPI0005F4BE32|nr:PREDICTED: esterase E4 [Vollenhovia emeryi]XP_011870477.1 PREDICTED: esterase E4 [Vollenhovia emeryi]XP_011870478.1 PREDICTED: esterase E4 [Vollenhovia emeryi]